MKSGKQRKAEIKAARLRRAARSKAGAGSQPWRLPANVVACNPGQLAPYNSYGQPRFVQRGYYEDQPFRCCDCGAQGLWTAERQQWWYEVAKGNVETRAVRCKSCRAIERARKAQARAVHQAGLLAKQARAAQ